MFIVEKRLIKQLWIENGQESSNLALIKLRGSHCGKNNELETNYVRKKSAKNLMTMCLYSF